MKVDLKDRIAVVTGAAGAIGRSTALMLAAERGDGRGQRFA